MNLEKHICDLLFRHECVIVPGFGAFIANYETATIQETTHTILPPRKFLVFNSQLTINDGLLAAEVSSAKKCSFETAMQFIKREVTIWNERLKTGKTIMLPGLGWFHLNQTGKLEFRPDPEQNFFNEAFGLIPLVAPPLPKRAPKTRPTTFVYHRAARKTSPKTIRRLAWAAAITFPLAIAGIWALMNFETLKQYATQHSGIINVTRFEPKPTATEQTWVFEEQVSPKPLVEETAEYAQMDEDSGEAFALEPEIEHADVSELIADAAPAIEAEPLPTPAVNQRAYHIIVGSFENMENARQLADELLLKGWNALVVDSKQGMHRVSIASDRDKNAALEQLLRIREEYNSGAWLLRI